MPYDVTGSITDFDSVRLGSNPNKATIKINKKMNNTDGFDGGFLVGSILGITLTSLVWYFVFSDKETKCKPEIQVEVTYPWCKDTIRTREELSLNLDGVLKTQYSVLDSNVVSIRKIK